MTRKRVVSRVVWWLLIVFVLFSSISVKAQSDQFGQWTTLTTLPFFPVHAHLLPTGKVMIWPGDIEGGGVSGNDPRLWNPADESLTTLAKPGYDLFCTGHAFLPDGRLFVAGGHISTAVGLPKASLYNPFSNTWAPAPDMNAGRWYPTVTTLANGDALVVSGNIDTTVGVNRLPQVYQTAAGTWRSLTSAQISLDLYPFMFLAPNGRVFNAGPVATTRYLDTAGTGAWSFVADRADPTYRDYGSAVMYADGKILVLGGGDPPTNTAAVIDLNQPSPTWRSVAPMSIGRRQLNTTLLPDGTVLVTGGTSGPGFNDPTHPVYLAELWDPATESFRPLASATVPRLYHSAAVLLPDGRVLSTGGNGYPTPEVFSPPYLFKGARPTMSAVPSTIGYGQPFSVQTPDAASITKVTLIRITSVTHAFNENQRISVLSFTPGAGTLDIVAPAIANVAPPGHYLLFIVNGNGVPSVGSIVQLGAAPGAATLASLSPSSAVAGGPGFTLTVNGTGFVNGATVRWNGQARTTTFVSSSQLTAAIPAGDIGAAGTRPVTVVNPGASASNALTFTITTPPSPGLVAAYGFDEGTGPTTADASGNGNTGSIANATWTTSGKFGNALVFNGTNAVVTVADAASLDLTTAMTLMLWVKPSSATTNFRHVIWKDYLAYFFSSNSDTGAPGIGGNYGGGQAFLYAPSALTVDAWTHLAATFDGTTLRIFVNGTQVASEARSGVIATSATNLKIGAADGFEFFAGVLDEVRIYNVALTQAQIQADMNTPVGGAAPGAATLTSLSPSSAVAGGPGFTLTVNGTGFASGASVQWNGVARTTTFVSGTQLTAAIPASDITAAGTSQVRVVNPGAAASNALTFTITAAAPAATLTSLSPSSAVAGGPGFTLTVNGTGFVSGATVQWNGGDRTTTFVSGSQLTAAIAAGDIGAAGTSQVRVVNPGAAASNALTFTITAAPPAAATLTSLSPSSAVAGGPAFTLTVNGTGFVNGATVRWNGQARTTTFVSGSQLTAAIPAGDIGAAGTSQVTVVNPGASASNALTFTITTPPSPGLVAAYGFDEGTGPTTADASGNGNTGSIANATWTTSGKFGNALVFNGTNAVVTVADAASLDLTTAMTLMLWVKPSSATTNFRHVIWKDYLAYFFSSNSDTGAPGIGGNYGGGQAFLYAPSALTVDAWTHLAATFDGTTLRIFVNGTQVASEARSGVIATSATNLKIGAADGFEFFAGVLDEVRIYNVALTQAQIQADMNTPVGGAAPGAATLTSLSPSSAVAGGPGFTLTVNGTGFASGASVQWNGVARTTTVVSGTQLTAAIPASDITAAGTSQVRVVNPGAAASNALTFTITAAAPAATLTSLSPSSAVAGGPGFTLTVNGTGFASGASVQWNGVARTTTVVSGSQLAAAIPAGDITAAGTSQVRVVNPGAAASNALTFTITAAAPAATLTSLSPSSAVAGGPGFTLTVNGTGFVAGASVQWNGGARTTTVVSGSQLAAAIPAGDIGAAGTSQVRVVNPGAAASNALTFTITPPASSFTLNVSRSGPGTVTSSPAGINCGADCSESYAAGTVVTLTATPNNNATFQGWGGAGSGTGARTVTMNANQSVTATFRKR